VTGIIDFGKSKIVSEKGQTLETEQLYYDQKMSGFTEKGLNLQMKRIFKRTRDRFSKDFKIINSQRLTGEFDSAE
jgi:hypothetical protein